MNSLFHLIINPYTAAYLIILVGTQAAYYQWKQRQCDRLTTHRLTRGLPPNILIHHPEPIKKRRSAALLEVSLLIITLVIVPVLLVGIANLIKSPESANDTHQNGLTLLFLGLLAITVFGGLQTAKAFVGGLAYKAIAAFAVPFQVGDYVTIKDTSGKVVQFNTFFTKISTLSGQQISLPTHTLWHEIITSATHPSAVQPATTSATASRSASSQSFSDQASSNQTSANQASQCEMVFYLSPAVTSQQHTIAENILLETIHASAYIEPSGPVEIYCAQTLEAIKLTAIAYVSAIEHSAAFSSEVTRQFLTFTERKQIPLASRE